MPSRRVAVVAAGVALLGAVALVAGVPLLRGDEPPAGTGELIAYGCKEKGNAWFAICVMATDRSDARRLTSGHPTTDAAWSPDGRRIAFTRHEEVGEYTTFAEDDVYAMDADGSDVRRLTDDVEGQHTVSPAWSPDGRVIAFVRGRAVASNIPGRPGSLFVMSDDGSGVRRLTRGWLDASPSWSPDGRRIAFSRAKDFGSSRGIWVLDVAQGAARDLTRHAHTSEWFDTAPAWSPDGRQIAFVRARFASTFDGKTALWVIKPDGTGLREVARYLHYDRATFSVSWSPDGRTIAVETSPAIGCLTISLVEVATGTLRPLTECKRPREATVSPAWQPDTGAGGS